MVTARLVGRKEVAVNPAIHVTWFVVPPPAVVTVGSWAFSAPAVLGLTQMGRGHLHLKGAAFISNPDGMKVVQGTHTRIW